MKQPRRMIKNQNLRKVRTYPQALLIHKIRINNLLINCLENQTHYLDKINRIKLQVLPITNNHHYQIQKTNHYLDSIKTQLHQILYWTLIKILKSHHYLALNYLLKNQTLHKLKCLGKLIRHKQDFNLVKLSNKMINNK